MRPNGRSLARGGGSGGRGQRKQNVNKFFCPRNTQHKVEPEQQVKVKMGWGRDSNARGEAGDEVGQWRSSS